jgi:hypothetical protein
VFFASSNVIFAASLLKEKTILFFGKVLRSEILAVLNPRSEHSLRKSFESAIIDSSSWPKSVDIMFGGDIKPS